jgi:hypothetical protein
MQLCLGYNFVHIHCQCATCSGAACSELVLPRGTFHMPESLSQVPVKSVAAPFVTETLLVLMLQQTHCHTFDPQKVVNDGLTQV